MSADGIMEAPKRYDAEALRDFATSLFMAAGLEQSKAAAVSDILVEADMLGHDTHGLELATRYLGDIESKSMTLSGDATVLSDRGACIAWDGRRLPGAWLVTEAMNMAFDRVAQYGTVSVAIGNGYHAGCFAAYLRRAAERELILSIHSSAPGVNSVAPFGGRGGALSPAPFAIGFPTGGDPVLIDISASITTMNMALRLSREGRQYAQPWLMDADGNPSNDPAVLQNSGTVLPAGGWTMVKRDTVGR